MRTDLAICLIAILGFTAEAHAQAPGFRDVEQAVTQMSAELGQKLADVKMAEKRAADLQGQADAAAEQLLTQTSEQAQATIEDAKKKAEEAKVAATLVGRVDTAQRGVLLAKIRAFNESSRSAAQWYNRAAVGIVVSGLVLSLITALAGFLNYSRAAGAISIIVAAVIAVPKAIPLNERASYYRILESNSYNVLLDFESSLTLSVEDYADAVRRLKVLVEYEAMKYPSGGDIGEISRGLINDLKSLHSPTSIKP